MIQELITRIRQAFTPSKPRGYTVDETGTTITFRQKDVPNVLGLMNRELVDPDVLYDRNGIRVHRPVNGRYRYSITNPVDADRAFYAATWIDIHAGKRVDDAFKAVGHRDIEVLRELDDEDPPADDPTLSFEENRLRRREWHLSRVAESVAEYHVLCANEGITPRADFVPLIERAQAKRRARERRATWRRFFE